MSRAEELAKDIERNWAIDETTDLFLNSAAAVIRRLAAVEEELSECKAAYESQFKELHALKKAISEAEPVAWMSRASLVNCEIDRARYGETGGDTYTSAASRNPFHDTPLYTLKGIK